MDRVIQTNNQTTIVKVDTGKAYRNKKKKNRLRVRQRRQHIYYKEVCGTIFQRADDPPQVCFRAVSSHPSAYLQIQNDSNCEMVAIIHMKTKQFTQIIRQAQQISIKVPSLRSLSVICGKGAAQHCRGKYNISIQSR